MERRFSIPANKMAQVYFNVAFNHSKDLGEADIAMRSALRSALQAALLGWVPICPI